MEITEINMLSDFEAGMKCLQNPSLISRLSPLPQVYSFCKWGALFFALFATFTSLLRNIKLLILRRINSWVSPAQPLLNQILAGGDDDFDFSDDDDDDVSSSCTVSDEDEDQEIDDYVFDHRNREQNGEDFSEVQGQNGNCGLRRRNGFSWSDFSAGKSVVKLWDSFRFALDFEDNEFDEDEISHWDFDCGDVKMCNIFGGRETQLPSGSKSVVLSADLAGNDSVVFGAYDTRMGRRESPAIFAEWRPRRGTVVNGVLTVGDLRNIKMPLEN